MIAYIFLLSFAVIAVSGLPLMLKLIPLTIKMRRFR